MKIYTHCFFYFCFVFFLNYSSEICAQTSDFTIRGQAVFAKSKKPVTGELAFIGWKEKYELQADSSGSFVFQVQNPKGRYLVGWYGPGDGPDSIRWYKYIACKEHVRLEKYKNKTLLIKFRPETWRDDVNDQLFLDGEWFSSIIPTVSVMAGRYLFTELGITYSPNHNYFKIPRNGTDRDPKNAVNNYYLKGGVEFNYIRPLVVAPKLSFHYRYMFILESGLNVLTYIGNGDAAFALRPETGVSFFGQAGVYYGYNFRFGGESLKRYVNTHQITFFIRLNSKNW